MDSRLLFDGLINYLCLIIIITFHEFAHAWTAWKCGDDTARLQGRVTLNPAAHIDPIGTIALPLIALVLSLTNSALASFIIGWGKPVMVNPANLRNRRWHDTLISAAGPLMNILMAAVLAYVIKAGIALENKELYESGVRLAGLSLFLAFFNLLPIPPLDGSHLIKNLMHMPEEAYMRISQYGMIMVIIVMQIEAVNQLLAFCTEESLTVFVRMASATFKIVGLT